MQAVLVVSFGTTFDDTRIKNIDAIEKAVEDKGYKVYSAFTSNMIMASLKKRGVIKDDTNQALEKMYADGVTDVIVMPTHILFGDEYNKMRSLIDYEKFNSVKITKPLLADEEDAKSVLAAIYEDTEKLNNEAIILMGHGTEHFYNCVYGATNFIASEMGYDDMYICTVEAYPSFEDAVNWAKRKGYKKAVLAPLMLVAGDHARNDMASHEEDSLATLLLQEGISSRSNIKGLGEYKKVLDLYIKHLEEI